MLDGMELKPSNMPNFKKKPKKIDDYFEGKHFRLTIGVKSEEDSSDLTGIDIAYLYRIIVTGDTSGFGSYSAQQIYGYLELLTDGEDWSLPDYKNDFFERDDLHEYIYPFIEDLLAEAKAAEKHIEVEGSKQIVLSRLRPLSTAPIESPQKDQAVQNPRGPYGPRDPDKKGLRPPRPRTLQERLTGVGFQIAFDLRDEKKFAEVSYRNKKSLCLISLNTDFPTVEPDNDDAIIANCCAAIAMDCLMRARYEDPNERFQFDEEVDPGNAQQLIESMSSLLRRVLPRNKDGKLKVAS
jgi:hypothetical protein